MGELNLKVMELLDAANTGTYGHPTPTPVRVSARQGKAILVTGHDLKDLEALLEQTEGKGINVYTHGEMLPAHGYPELRKHTHLVGNYGGAWQDQSTRVRQLPRRHPVHHQLHPEAQGQLPGAGLHQRPGRLPGRAPHRRPRLRARSSRRRWPRPASPPTSRSKRITVGFGHQAVLGVADKVIEAVKKGAIKHFFLIGGCDGAKTGRNYYTEFAEAVPKDCVILTLACGKYRFNKLDFGDIGGIPRLLDIGQCNDAYSAIQIAVALAKAFDTDVNGLPLSLILSWYEQKAVAVLLTLLHLGIKNIRLGPSLPAFVTPAALDVLVEKFGDQADRDARGRSRGLPRVAATARPGQRRNSEVTPTLGPALLPRGPEALGAPRV